MKHWQRIVTAWMLAVAVLLAVHPASAQEGKKAPPVILDTDMVDWFDDGAAMILLAKSPKTDLLGVTVVLGNTWVETGTASAIRQLEGAGIKDVPVFMGVNAPVREDRFRYIAEEKSRFGRGADSHMGAAGYDRPVSWQDAYRKNYGAEPELRPMKQSAPDFIIQTVRARPHEVTIVSIGSGANLAAALRKDPEIAPLVKRVVYMAGSFFQQGNVMPYAEFNVWIDPEAMQAAFRAPFGAQVIVPLDACEKIHITRDRFFQMQKMVKNPVFADLIAKHWMTPLFKDKGQFNDYIWDVLAAAAAIDPSVITEEVTYPVDVDAVYGPCHGATMAFKGQGPDGTQKARIVLTVDEEKVWNMIFDLCRSL